MSWVFAILLVLLLAVGSFFVLVGSFSLLKLSEFFKRLHGPTKASTLGVGCVLLASVGYHWFSDTDPQPRELLITAFLFITAPISALTFSMSRSLGGRSVTSRSPMRMRPELTSSRPASMRRDVDLPHPDGPRRQATSPGGTARCTSRTTVSLP